MKLAIGGIHDVLGSSVMDTATVGRYVVQPPAGAPPRRLGLTAPQAV